MTYFFIFALSLIFWASIWWVSGKVTDKYLQWKHDQSSKEFFRNIERFRRDFE